MTKVLIVGVGGLAREFAAFFGPAGAGLVEIAGWSSNRPQDLHGLDAPGFDNDVTPAAAGTDKAVIAIGTPGARCALWAKLAANGFSFPSFVHPAATVAHSAALADGVIVSPGCVVGPNARLERGVWLNCGAFAGHEAAVGEFTQINVNAVISGNCSIGEQCTIGSGAAIHQKVVVGARAIIGLGAAVFSNAAPEATMVGNPARPLVGFSKK